MPITLIRCRRRHIAFDITLIITDTLRHAVIDYFLFCLSVRLSLSIFMPLIFAASIYMMRPLKLFIDLDIY